MALWEDKVCLLFDEKKAGIDMSECRPHHKVDRSHFMIWRFDRDDAGRKIYMQSLGAMQHFDFNDPSSYSFEQAIRTIRELRLGMDAVEKQYKRPVFNVITRNQDDHVKNISFFMDRSGAWRLSPAYDIAYSYNPQGAWTQDHQMSLAGKRNDFTHGNLLDFASNVGLKPARAKRAIEEVMASVNEWQDHAKEAAVPPPDATRIEKAFRRDLKNK